MDTRNELLYCPVCETDTEHAEKWRRDPSRSHEAPKKARLDELLGVEAAARWAAPLALDELRAEAVCHRLFTRICDVEEQDGTTY